MLSQRPHSLIPPQPLAAPFASTRKTHTHMHFFLPRCSQAIPAFRKKTLVIASANNLIPSFEMKTLKGIKCQLERVRSFFRLAGEFN